MNMNPYPNPISEEPKPPKTKSKVGKGCLIAGLVGAGGAVLLFIVALIFVFSFSGTVYIPDNGVLVLKVAGNHPDYKPRDPVADFFEIPQPTSFSDLVKQLRKAKVDKRIRGVLIELQDNDLGWARANELRESIKDFRISGKPVYAYMESGGNKEYFIATAADKIAIPSAGDLFINGLAAGVTFYRGSLDKLGVDAEVIQIGKYKNAPDQFTRKSMSDQQREVVDALLDKHFDTLIATIAATRGIDRETVKSLIDNAPYRASDAKENRLIDIIGSKDFVHEEMKRALRIGTDEMFESVSMTDYATVTEEALGLGTGEKIAIVYASGAIDVGTSREDPLMGTTMGSETISDSIKEAADDSAASLVIPITSRRPRPRDWNDDFDFDIKIATLWLVASACRCNNFCNLKARLPGYTISTSKSCFDCKQLFRDVDAGRRRNRNDNFEIDIEITLIRRVAVARRDARSNFEAVRLSLHTRRVAEPRRHLKRIDINAGARRFRNWHIDGQFDVEFALIGVVAVTRNARRCNFKLRAA